jgi:hypothetical protein
MHLDRVTAEIRPRNGWEAVDLGLALVRRDFWRLLGIWWAAALPVLAVLPLLGRHPFWWLVVWWWCKPAWSRMVLFDLSRRLFGERPGWRALAREAVTGGWRTFGARMLWGRWSPRRLLALPVEELEGLRGAALAHRTRLVLRRAGGSAVALSVAGVTLSGWAGVTFLLLFVWLLPEGLGQAWFDAWELWGASDSAVPPLLLGWTFAGAAAAGSSLADVFATGAGFGLYLNHRSWIEGWDVELVFKRLAERLRTVVAAAVVVAAAWPGWVDAAAAADRDPGPRQVIERVLAHEDFRVHKETRWVPQHAVARELVLPAFLLEAQRTLAWAMLAAAAAALLAGGIWLVRRYGYVLHGMPSTSRITRRRRNGILVSGLPSPSANLPVDPPTVAARWWAAGRQREALGLLYRAAVAGLVDHHQLDLGDATTEYDCVRRVAAANAGDAGYFGVLTDTWVRLAYGGRAVGDDEMAGLCRGWPYPTDGER